VVDAHFYHFLGHISQALQRAGHPAANFSYFGPRRPLTPTAFAAIRIGHIYQILVAEYGSWGGPFYVNWCLE
jgi:hypothetical protein